MLVTGISLGLGEVAAWGRMGRGGVTACWDRWTPTATITTAATAAIATAALIADLGTHRRRVSACSARGTTSAGGGVLTESARKLRRRVSKDGSVITQVLPQ